MKTTAEWLTWFHKTHLKDPDDDRSPVAILIEMVQADAYRAGLETAAGECAEVAAELNDHCHGGSECEVRIRALIKGH